MFNLYYSLVSILNFWNINITNNSLYNIFLIKLNNIKLNYIFINQFLLMYQPITITLINVSVCLWALSLISYKILTISNFYYGYVKIHPPLQYIGSILTFYVIINKKHILNHTILRILVILIIAFILGSLWALFQSIWGYYWSNDTIEYILLFFIIIISIKIHTYFKKKTKFSGLFITYSLILLLFLRLNLLYTKHNFFLKTANIKYFIFFLQNTLLYESFNIKKHKEKNNNFKLILFINIFLLIFFNKLNLFFIKLFIWYIFIISWTYLIYYITSVTNNKITHLLLYVIIAIYVYLYIKYNSIHKYKLFFVKNKLNLFYFNKINNLLYIKKHSNINYNIYLQSNYFKNFNQINTTNLTIKKIVNYF